MTLLEVPVFSPASATAAIQAGAHRLELNRAGSYPQGGLTPDVADLQALSSADVPPESAFSSLPPLRIMIRPRGPSAGEPDFVYSDAEFAEMRASVLKFKDSGLMRLERGDGFVFGILKAHGTEAERHGAKAEAVVVVVVVDVDRNRELVELAAPWPCVFHRAFVSISGSQKRYCRSCANPFSQDDVLGSAGSTPEEALADLDTCGFRGLLTSGGPGSAADHTETLRDIIRSATPSLGAIIVGGGVRSSNVQKLRESLLSREGTPVHVWFHSSCLTNTAESDVVDETELRAIVEGLAEGG